MIIRKNLMKKDITGVSGYQRWYKPFDDEKRLALMVDEDLIINDQTVNVIDWKGGSAILCADAKDKDWAKRIEERINNGYEIELYIKSSLFNDRYVQVEVKKLELTDQGSFIINF
jgi:hypothetical protein